MLTAAFVVLIGVSLIILMTLLEGWMEKKLKPPVHVYRLITSRGPYTTKAGRVEQVVRLSCGHVLVIHFNEVKEVICEECEMECPEAASEKPR